MAIPNTPVVIDAPVLDISTLVDRPRVVIDGESYELKHPGEFSIVEQMRMMRQAKRIMVLVDRLMGDAEPTEAEECEYTTLSEASCRRVLIAPDDVHAKLREPHRVAIVQAFTALQSTTSRQATGASETAAEQTPTPTGASTSPTLSASTEAIPSNG
jgi:hypothetical protein